MTVVSKSALVNWYVFDSVGALCLQDKTILCGKDRFVHVQFDQV